jgi:hypothetical protein
MSHEIREDGMSLGAIFLTMLYPLPSRREGGYNVAASTSDINTLASVLASVLEEDFDEHFVMIAGAGAIEVVVEATRRGVHGEGVWGAMFLDVCQELCDTFVFHISVYCKDVVSRSGKDTRVSVVGVEACLCAVVRVLPQAGILSFSLTANLEYFAKWSRTLVWLWLSLLRRLVC